MPGRMEGKQRVDMTSMYNALKALGHQRVWLLTLSTGTLLMVTFERRVIAGYDSIHKTWLLRKYADLVDGYPLGCIPVGSELIELTHDNEELFNLTISQF